MQMPADLIFGDVSAFPSAIYHVSCIQWSQCPLLWIAVMVCSRFVEPMALLVRNDVSGHAL